MSTKLYEAYKLPKMNITKLFSLVEQVKKKVRVAQRKRFEKELFEQALEMFDRKTLNPELKVISPNTYHGEGEANALSLIKNQMDYEMKKSKGEGKMNEYYFHVDIMALKSQLYAVCRQYPGNKFDKIFAKVFKGKLYEYWNNTDQPKGMTRAQWKAREREWDKVFGDSSWATDESKNPMRIEFEFSPYRENHTKLKIPKELLSPEKRLSQVAENQLVKEKFPDKLKENEWLKVWDYIKSDEYKAKKKALIETLAPKLVVNPTPEEILKATYNVVKTHPKKGEVYHNG